jgi:hypothetical protein
MYYQTRIYMCAIIKIAGDNVFIPKKRSRWLIDAARTLK